MGNNNLKDLWKSSINEDIRFYSEPELNNMVIKCSRRSMQKLHPRWILRTIIILIITFIVWKLVSENEDIAPIILGFILISILAGSLILMEWSTRKMIKYSYDIPVKDWIKNRICEIERSIRLQKKYDVLIHFIALALSTCTYVLYIYTLKITFDLIAFIVALFMILSCVLALRIAAKKNYKKALRSLQQLYNQIEP
jgi:hypothetical protein|nr:hypothetical protein [uncultured Bacteroides sp.]